MQIEEGSNILIIRPKWADMILNGEKTVELRGMRCNKHENTRVYIAKSKTSKIYGYVTFKTCVGPLSESEFESLRELHVYDGKMPYEKTFAWFFTNAVSMEPISFKKKKGAIVWVKYENCD